VLKALDAFDDGLDFADALHPARSARASSCGTFDWRFARGVATTTLTPPVELLG
jgi:hypothetical protein